MSFIKWNDSYNVNVELIDKQHKVLVSIINDLHDAMLAGKGKDVLSSTYTRLLDYTNTHFAAEEGLLKTYAYPDFSVHQAAHVMLVKQVKDLQQKLVANNFTLTMETSQFLKDWLLKHVQGTDKRYSAHLNSKGVH
jgi:hemerythrin